MNYIISATNTKCKHKWNLVYTSRVHNMNDWRCDKCGAAHGNSGDPQKPWNNPNNTEIFA